MSFGLIDHILYGDVMAEAKHHKRELYLGTLYGFVKPIIFNMPQHYHVDETKKSYLPNTNIEKAKTKDRHIKT